MNDNYRRGEWTNYNVMWKKHYHKSKSTVGINNTFQKINFQPKPNTFMLFYPLKNEMWNEIHGKGFPLLGLNSVGNSANLDYSLFLNHLDEKTLAFFLTFLKSSHLSFKKKVIILNLLKYQTLKRFFFARYLDSLKLKNSGSINSNTLFFSKSKLNVFYLNKLKNKFTYNNTNRNLFFKPLHFLNGFSQLPINYLQYLLRTLKRKNRKQKDKNFFYRNTSLLKIKKAERFYIIQRKKLLQKTWFYPYFLKRKLQKITYFNKFKYFFNTEQIFLKYIKNIVQDKFIKFSITCWNS